jgi:hypothetical protein
MMSSGEPNSATRRWISVLVNGSMNFLFTFFCVRVSKGGSRWKRGGL